MTTVPAVVADLRRRLEEERSAIIGEIALGDHLAPGFLRILADVQTGIDAIDADRIDQPDPTQARLRVRDVDGEPLALGIFAQNGDATAVELSPLRALNLAGDLIAAARRRMTWATN
ncbi:hypothetical protein [Azospirillum sp.]|uniref:hypothetical protein n=1 Tax=Azospirillum sp. TaxID=34012 RepID=UPI003D72BA13